MAESMTLEETIAHFEEWAKHLGIQDRSALYWLTTLKAENERLRAGINGAIDCFFEWHPARDALQELLKETEPSDG